MVNRIVVGADSFSIHGKFDEQGMFLLMEEGDILSDEDFARIVTFVDDHRKQRNLISRSVCMHPDWNSNIR